MKRYNLGIIGAVNRLNREEFAAIIAPPNGIRKIKEPPPIKRTRNAPGQESC